MQLAGAGLRSLSGASASATKQDASTMAGAYSRRVSSKNFNFFSTCMLLVLSVWSLHGACNRTQHCPRQPGNDNRPVGQHLTTLHHFRLLKAGKLNQDASQASAVQVLQLLQDMVVARAGGPTCVLQGANTSRGVPVVHATCAVNRMHMSRPMSRGPPRLLKLPPTCITRLHPQRGSAMWPC